MSVLDVDFKREILRKRCRAICTEGSENLELALLEQLTHYVRSSTRFLSIEEQEMVIQGISELVAAVEELVEQ